MVSFNPSLLTLQAEDGKPHILGSQCSSCGKVFFPQQSLCTDCLKEGTVRAHPLGQRGTIYSYTIVERESLAPKGFQVPYAYGYIQFPEGVRVLSKIIGWTPGTLKIDSPVEMVLEEIRQNAEGEQVMGFRFKVVA